MIRVQQSKSPIRASEAAGLLRAALSGQQKLTAEQVQAVKTTIPRYREHVYDWVRAFTGVKIARNAVCRGHSAPLDMFAQQVLERPSQTVWVGPRGGGKSFLSAIDTHLTSRFNPKHETRVLGGSRAQSQQIYEAIIKAVTDGHGPLGSDSEAIGDLLKTLARYVNGSTVEILAASPKSVRGPHIPSLKIDEVDEIAEDIFQSAMGMAMNQRGQSSSILMTSTWHRMGGPMERLIERAKSNGFPVHTFCIFEVLETCDDARSGPNLERCPECALMPWCHSDMAQGDEGVGESGGNGEHVGGRGPGIPSSPLVQIGGPSGNADIGREVARTDASNPLLARGIRSYAGARGIPKAKRSDGHYAIDSVIQKISVMSPRVFASDFLCLRPQAESVWFSRFDETLNMADVEWNPDLPVYASIDCGVWTGAVFFQTDTHHPHRPVWVIGEYLSEDVGADQAARDIIAALDVIAPGVIDNRAMLRISMDSAGRSKTSIGKTVVQEYQQAGLILRNDYMPWETYPGSVLDTLNHLESFVSSADGRHPLQISHRCDNLRRAFLSFSRKRVNGQLTDKPEDVQHPHEEMIDALRGGLSSIYPARKMKQKPTGGNRAHLRSII